MTSDGNNNGTAGTSEINKNYPIDSGIGDVMNLIPEQGSDVSRKYKQLI